MLSPVALVDPSLATVPDDSALLDPATGLLRLLPSASYKAMESLGLRLWCHRHARYGLPTWELVTWLREFVCGRDAIEIGAGAGDLCHHLGIPGYDNRMQEWTAIRALYAAGGQPVIRYGAHVQTGDALDVITRRRPDVVVASWVTEWISPDQPAPPSAAGGNIYGVKESAILDTGVTYILIGNLSVHGGKAILRRPHREYRLPFLHSRSAHPELDRVWVWEGNYGH